MDRRPVPATGRRKTSTQFHELFAALGLRWTDAAQRDLARSNRDAQGLVTMRVAGDQPERWRKRLTGDQVREISGVLASFPVVARLL